MLSMLFLACEAEQTDELQEQYAKVKIKTTEAATTTGVSCETAFAFNESGNASCFINDGFRRWGWSNGAIASGDYSFNLYAGAGQCDTNKGALVGTLEVSYDETSGNVTVGFHMANDNFTMDETHLYVGNEPYPYNRNKITVAPGKYPYQNDLDAAARDVYELSGFSGELYIIAHAVVCGNGDGSTGDVEDTPPDNGGDTPPFLVE